VGSLGAAIFAALVSLVAFRYESARLGDVAARPANFGIYEVDSFTRDGVDAPPLTTDTKRWRWLTIDRASNGDWPARAGIWRMSGERDSRGAREGTEGRTLTLNGRGSVPPATLDVARPDADHIVLTGSVDGESLVVRAHRLDERSFRLVSHGFRWIIERFDAR
jgi:hypothetical protein